MDSTQGVTFKKVLMIGISAALVCVVVVGGAIIYLNNKTASGIQKNVILDDVNSSSTYEDLGPREGGVFTRMGIINPPFIEETVKRVVATTTPAIATTTVTKATTTPVVKPKPKPKPKPEPEIIEDDSSTEVSADDVTVDDSEVTVDDEVIEDNSVDVQDNPGI